jgi:hypothetical protein
LSVCLLRTPVCLDGHWAHAYNAGLFTALPAPGGNLHFLHLSPLLIRQLDNDFGLKLFPAPLNTFFHRLDEDTFAALVVAIHLQTYRLLAKNGDTTTTLDVFSRRTLRGTPTLLLDRTFKVSADCVLAQCPEYVKKEDPPVDNKISPNQKYATKSLTEVVIIAEGSKTGVKTVDVTEGKHIVLGGRRANQADGCGAHGWDQMKYSSLIASNLTLREHSCLDAATLQREVSKSGKPLLIWSIKPCEYPANDNLAFCCGDNLDRFLEPYVPRTLLHPSYSS